MDWLEWTETGLRWIYYIASIALVISLFFGFKQLKTLKYDISIRNQRAAFEKTIEYMEWFSQYIETISKFNIQFVQLKKEVIERSRDEQSKKLLSDLSFTIKVDIDKEDTFDKYVTNTTLDAVRLDLLRTSGAVHLLNELEIFAAVMNCRIADEDMAFTPLSDSYCEIVGYFYSMICQERSNNPKLYSNIVNLHRLWKRRIIKNRIKSEIDQKHKQLSQIPDTKTTPFGV